MLGWHVTAATGVEQTAKELIEQESLMTLESRQRVTTETTRKEWTEYEGICRFLLVFIVKQQLHMVPTSTSFLMFC